MADASLRIPQYTYVPLPPRHIRLLRYTAARPNTVLAISLSITTCDLDKFSQPYIALSYTWDVPIAGNDQAAGDDSDTELVLIESTTEAHAEIAVRSNLYNALQTLGPAMLQKSRHDNVCHVWIDAICINQDDVIERSNQVALMGYIYSSATSVWGWLGAEDDTTPAVIQLHTEVFEAIKDQITIHGPLSHSDVAGEANGIRLPKLSLVIRDGQVNALFKFYARRRLLNRLWVVQELVLGQCVRLWVGSQSISMDSVNLWTQLVTRFPEFRLSPAVGLDEVGDAFLNLRAFFLVTAIADQHAMGGPGDPRYQPLLRQAYGATVGEASRCSAYFEHLLVLTSNHDSTDARDKVYGILGLIQPFWPAAEAGLIVADYSKNEQQVYYDMTIWCMRFRSSLSIISLVHHSSDTLGSDLPSWVPDIGTRRHGAAALLQHHRFTPPTSEDYIAFHANGITSTASPRFGIRVSPKNDVGGEAARSAVVECLRLGVTHDATAAKASFVASITVTLGGVYKLIEPQELAIKGRERCIALLREPSCTIGSEILAHIEHLGGYTVGTLPEDHYDTLLTIAAAWEGQLSINFARRRMFRTDTGLIGMAHDAARPGDQVWIFSDAKVPFLLRQQPCGAERYSLVGEVYVQSAMFGEQVDRDNSDMWRIIEIV
ncbi:Folylpolyglutamate synthetase [Oleoguttula sp. CCFEE 5521]